MKKKLVLRLDREVIRKLTPAQHREAAGGIITVGSVCYRVSGISCECTQICTF